MRPNSNSRSSPGRPHPNYELSAADNAADIAKVLRRYEARVPEHIHEMAIQQALRLEASGRFNTFITLGYENNGSWRSGVRNLAPADLLKERVHRFMHQLAVEFHGRKKLADITLSNRIDFLGFFECEDRAGKPVYPHFHILLNTPAAQKSWLIAKDGGRAIWLRLLKEHIIHPVAHYDCQPIAGKAEVATYVTKDVRRNNNLAHVIDPHSYAEAWTKNQTEKRRTGT